MWNNIVGLMLVAGGIPALAWPHHLQRKLRRKSLRYVTGWLFVCLVSTGGLLLSLAWQHEGWIPKFAGIAGFVILLKTLFLVRSRIGKVLAEKLMVVPPLYLRAYALCQMAVGIGIYLLGKSSS